MAEPQAGDILAPIAQGDHAALAAALDGGASPDSADSWGVTALAHAAARGDLESLGILLDRKAAVDRPSAVGNTPVMAAAAAGHIDAVRILLDRGANPLAANKWGFGPQDWASWPANASEMLALLRSRTA